ncbi:unnamed protein product [Coregonus sp. 'balchen']|nr:unnamed protein product [Coregonus sp. 'balchen']
MVRCLFIKAAWCESRQRWDSPSVCLCLRRCVSVDWHSSECKMLFSLGMLMLSATQIYTIFTVQLFAFLNLLPVEADISAYTFDNKTGNFDDLPARFGYRLPSDGLKAPAYPASRVLICVVRCTYPELCLAESNSKKAVPFPPR